MKRFFLLFNPTEVTVCVYSLFVGSAILVASPKDSFDLALVAIHICLVLVIAGVAYLAKSKSGNPFFVQIRNWYPALMIPFFYRELSYVVPRVNPHDIDTWLIQLDFFIFGVHPTVWFERFTYPILTEILQIAYSSYYFLPILLGVALSRNDRRMTFIHVFFGTVLVILVSYVGYVFFPAVGPRFSLHHLQTISLKGCFLTLAIRELLNDLELITRDCFPSGHTMVTIVVTYYAWKYKRTLFYCFLPVTILIVSSTVYLRYHYAVDIIAGVLLVAPILYFANYCMKKWERAQREHHQYPDPSL